MSHLPLKYARNGALAGIGLYLMIVTPLLTLSLSYMQSPSPVSTPPNQLVQQLSQLAIALLAS